jgi:hypothetical protein
MEASSETEPAGPPVPAFGSFLDVRRLLDHRAQLRADLRELDRVRLERAAVKSSIATPDPWRACTSPSPAFVGAGFVLRDDGAKGRLAAVNLTEVDREIGGKREELRKLDCSGHGFFSFWFSFSSITRH